MTHGRSDYRRNRPGPGYPRGYYAEPPGDMHRITYNGQTVTALAAYRGRDAGAAGWPAYQGCGPTLSVVDAGPDLTFQGSGLVPWFGGERHVGFGAATRDYLQSTDTAAVDLGTACLIVEVFGAGPAGNATIWSKFASSTNFFEVRWQNLSGLPSLILIGRGTVTGQRSVSSLGVALGVMHHGLCFVDPATTGRWYVDGVGSGTLQATDHNDWNFPCNPTVGARTGGTVQGAMTFGSLAIFAGPSNWFTYNDSAQAAAAAERQRLYLA